MLQLTKQQISKYRYNVLRRKLELLFPILISTFQESFYSEFMMNQDIEQANSYYKQSQESRTGSRALKRGYLEKALRLYQKHVALSRDAQQLSPLLRNIAMTNFRLAEVIDEGNEVSHDDLNITTNKNVFDLVGSFKSYCI